MWDAEGRMVGTRARAWGNSRGAITEGLICPMSRGEGIVPSEAELVRGVQRGDLIALGEGGIVEHGLQEVVEPAAQAQHGLPDVYELGRARTNAVDPEQPPVLPVEQHLEHPAVVAQDLPAGNLSEIGRASCRERV